MPPQPLALIVLADDVTGAADTAARIHAAGLDAAILLGPGPAGGQALALTSDSRHVDAGAAAERVRAAVASIGARPGAIWYKKIDSTLRGHIAAELDAMLDALGRRCAVVCPAFPAQRRALVDGLLVAPDLVGPPPSLPELLAAARRPAAHIGLETVRAGVDALAGRLAELAGAGAELLAVDAQDDADLETIEASVAAALPDALRCGSAGLAGALARRLARAQGRGGHAPHPHPLSHGHSHPAGPALLVIGSASAAAGRQIAVLRQRQRVRCLTLAPEGTPALYSAAPALLPALQAAEERGGRGDWSAVLLQLPPAAPGTPLDGPDARALAEQLAAAACDLIERQEPGLLILSGGDTAGTVLRRLGVRRLDVLDELLPGMPLAAGADSRGRIRRVVLKAGAHGEDDALVELLRRTRDEEISL